MARYDDADPRFIVMGADKLCYGPFSDARVAALWAAQHYRANDWVIVKLSSQTKT